MFAKRFTVDILVLGLLHLVELILHLSDGSLVFLAQMMGSLFALHVHVLKELAKLGKLRVALLVHLRLGKCLKRC